MPAQTPSALLKEASCFLTCIPKGMNESVITYQMAVLAGVDISNPRGVANDARCFFMCIPEGEQLAVQNYILTQVLQ